MNLVTGANGMLGAQLVKQLLQRGEKVTALVRATSNLAFLKNYESQITFVEGDILDVISIENAMQGISKVYHCAATISFVPSERNKMFKTNIEGTANIVNACLDFNIDKLVHVSSIAAFGNSKENILLNETAQYEEDDINSAYAKSKFLGEMEVWRGMAEGLKAVIVNPSLIVGPGWWKGTGPSALFKKIDDGLPTYTSGSNGYVDVRDMAATMIQLMQSDIANQRFVVSGENLSYLDFFTLVADALGKKKPFIKVSNSLGFVVSIADNLRAKLTNSNPLITSEMVQLANKKMLFDNAKICKVLNYSFIPINQTINDTAKIYLESKVANADYGVF